jgi:hypothetical protein
MDTDLAEVAPESGLQEAADPGIERPAGRAQHLVHGRRRLAFHPAER